MSNSYNTKNQTKEVRKHANRAFSLARANYYDDYEGSKPMREQATHDQHVRCDCEDAPCCGCNS